eukprot:scaffold55684_cov101-Phaeocystis_antarctica.AAC.2
MSMYMCMCMCMYVSSRNLRRRCLRAAGTASRARARSSLSRSREACVTTMSRASYATAAGSRAAAERQARGLDNGTSDPRRRPEGDQGRCTSCVGRARAPRHADEHEAHHAAAGQRAHLRGRARHQQLENRPAHRTGFVRARGPTPEL